MFIIGKTRNMLNHAYEICFDMLWKKSRYQMKVKMDCKIA